MKAPQGGILLVIYLAVSMTAVCAGPQSLLDPYASIQAPSSKTKSNKVSPFKSESKKAGNNDLSADGQESKGEDKINKPVRVKAQKKDNQLPIKGHGQENATKKTKTISSGTGVMSGIKDIKSGYVKTFKAAGSEIMTGSKVAGEKMTSGAKIIKERFASSAKSSGQYIVKSARAVSAGIKTTGSKVRDKASSVGKLAVAPGKLNHTDKKQGPNNLANAQSESGSAVLSEKVLDDASFPGRPLEPLSTKPLVKGGSSRGVFGRTMAKLNVFSRSKKQPDIATPRAQASDPSHPFPN